MGHGDSMTLASVYAQRAQEKALIDLNMKSNAKEAVLRAYALRNEIFNKRLDESEKYQLSSSNQSNEVRFAALKDNTYDPGTLFEAVQFLKALQVKLESHLSHQ